MKVFVVTFPGWLHAGHAVIAAHSREQAVDLVQEEICSVFSGSWPAGSDHVTEKIQIAVEACKIVVELDLEEPHAVIISDGNY